MKESEFLFIKVRLFERLERVAEIHPLAQPAYRRLAHLAMAFQDYMFNYSNWMRIRQDGGFSTLIRWENGIDEGIILNRGI